ncbi:MAG: DUF1223 domain-containing protein [Caulobacteraceae bacterium]
MRKSFGPALFALAMTAAAPAAFAQAERPVVVELFTSQGCSSCPSANAAVATLAGRPDVLALSFGVTYWDDLGWKDTFASPQYTARQWDYARSLHHSQVWTPQVVVDGRVDTVGQTPAQIEPLIRAAKARRGDGPRIDIQGDRVTIAAAAARPGAQVWLVRYDPRVVQVPIRRGENGGRTLPHRNVVRELVKLGDWSGAAKSLTIAPAKDPNLKTAVLIQAGPGGAILAAQAG